MVGKTGKAGKADVIGRILLACCCASVLTACGLKDDLYLPTPATQEAPAPSPDDAPGTQSEEDPDEPGASRTSG
jgi:predicted small lipoprotein YifL